MGKRGRRHNRRILDANAVMNLVPFLQSTQNGDRVLDVGLANKNNLETSFQCRILLDIFCGTRSA